MAPLTPRRRTLARQAILKAAGDPDGHMEACRLLAPKFDVSVKGVWWWWYTGKIPARRVAKLAKLAGLLTHQVDPVVFPPP